MSLEKVNKYKSKSSLSINSALGIMFIVLKLCHVIDWSWWWVTAPFWIPLIVVLVVLITLIVTGNLIKLGETLKSLASD